MTSDGEWITAEELELETKVCTITGERISLEAKEIVRNVNPKIMYDLEIEGNHNYFVSERDLLVHNASCTGGLDPEMLEIGKNVKKEREAAKQAGEAVDKNKVYEFDRNYTNRSFLDKVSKNGETFAENGKKVTFMDETKVMINGRDVVVKDARILEKNREKIVYERFVKTYNVDINRGIKGATPEYVDFKVASYRPVYSDSQVIRGTEIHFSDLTGNYQNQFQEGNKILVKEIVPKDDTVNEFLGKDFKVTESKVFARDKKTGEYVSYTWHHDLKGDEMYLVRTDVHKAGTHMGPNSVINSLDKTGIDGEEAWDWLKDDKIGGTVRDLPNYDESFVNKRSKK